MNRILHRRFHRKRGIELNLAPFMDMVFILLIFFLVTSTFSRESGIEVDRPVAKSASSIEKTNLMIGIDKRGLIYLDGKQLDIRLLRSRIARELYKNPDLNVVILCDKETKTGLLIEVLDICKLTGVKNISVAAKKPENFRK